MTFSPRAVTVRTSGSRRPGTDRREHHRAGAARAQGAPSLAAHRPRRAVRPLDGSPAPDGEHPAALAGSAAAAAAVGDTASRDDLLDRAGKLDEEHATYYGSAVHALARVMLTTRGLGGC